MLQVRRLPKLRARKLPDGIWQPLCQSFTFLESFGDESQFWPSSPSFFPPALPAKPENMPNMFWVFR
ncbi:hypothetical protein SAMN04244574_04521 [Azotobacter beijerinckii]|uniref:Uncharacterized protein n=1 Tax=Azotobacter beijerinckii TaxID=170623 RepID=A0A1I4IA58_9GAMM|nr:hypothetical protein SAMN04244574_04521 [Azotobacter beijerinckii]